MAPLSLSDLMVILTVRYYYTVYYIMTQCGQDGTPPFIEQSEEKMERLPQVVIPP